MNVIEAAEYLGLSRSIVYELCSTKQIRHRRIGLKRGRIDILREWCDEYLAAGEVAPEGEKPSSTSPPPVARVETIVPTEADRAILEKYRRKGRKRA